MIILANMWGLKRGPVQQSQSLSKNRKPYGAENNGSNSKVLNAIARQLRVLKERVSELETQNSILKRDLSRIDRASYRATELKVKPRSKTSNDHEDDVWSTAKWSNQ